MLFFCEVVVVIVVALVDSGFEVCYVFNAGIKKVFFQETRMVSKLAELVFVESDSFGREFG